MDSWTCPACGHKHSVPPRRHGKNVVCASCDEMFPAPKERITRKQVEERKATVANEKRQTRSGSPIARLLLDDPRKALESGVAGAIGGILAGVVIGFINGFVAKDATMRVTGGCVFGLGIGLVIGALWGPYGMLARIGIRLPPVIATAFAGALAGLAIAALVGMGVLGSTAWLPIGAAVGAAGAGLWALLCMHVEAGEPTRTRREVDEDLSAYYESRLRRR